VLTLLLTGILSLTFKIQLVKASGTIYIRADGSVDPSTAAIQRVGNVYTFTADIYDSIVVEKDNVIINGNGYTLQGAGTGNGFYLNGRTNVTIKNVRIVQFYTGIYLAYSTINIIAKNTVSSNSQGINLYQSTSNTVSNNTVTSNQEGIIVYQGSNYTTVENNTVDSNGLGIDTGMANWCTITRNNITNNMFGIWLGYSSNNMLKGNNITSNYLGIRIDSSGNNTVSGNNVTSNNYVGIRLDYSKSNNNEISGNIVSNNDYGVFLASSANNNKIQGNNITNNNRGIYLSGTVNNMFFHNNLVGNTQQLVNYDSTNLWDNGYPSGGNYWSDYSINYPAVRDDFQGENQDVLGCDGIWDHPYEIDAGNLDNYPLTEPCIPVERKVSVKVGDWVKYGNFDVAWSSNDPDSEMPGGIAILSETEWLENSVEAILGSKIKYKQLLHFKDGSEYSTTCWIDIDIGSGTALTFISSGLGPDDCIYASAPWFAWKLNETTSRQYIGVPREVNCLSITTPMQFGPPPAYPNSTGNFYWDEETGVLCELSMKHLNQTGSYITSWSVFYEIVDTNLWEAPTPAEETQELIEKLEAWNLPKGTENSLTSKLERALHLLAIGNENGAIHKLMDFISQVEALRGKKLNDEQADYLVSEAQRIIDLING